MTRNTIAGLALMAAVSPGFAESFQITPGEPNLVRFESKAPLETFDGKTRQVRGHVKLDPADLSEWIEVNVEVDLASFDTGIAIRNRHMRENHLETDKYPSAVFKGGKVHDASQTQIRAGETVRFEIEGVLSLHGVEKPLRAPIEMTLETVDGRTQIRVAASFRLKLSDHDIKRPKFLIMKLDEVQRLSVELVAKAGE
jgi:polyisoprenoid-binding protein YceI